MIVLNTLSRKRISKTLVSRIFTVLFSCIIISTILSCGSSKPKVVTTKRQAAKRNKTRVASTSSSSTKKKRSSNVSSSTDTNEISTPLLKSVVENAMSYEGTRYKYGGSTRKGMDCSGLIHISFKEAGKTVPRTSSSLFNASTPVKFKQVSKGDLLFFATGKNKSRLNHVGLVVKITPAEVSFIHASSSRGVMVSTMNEAYWLNAYLSAGRLK